MALTNIEKQARYRERHLGVDGEKVRVGLILDASTRAQMGRPARRKGYTLTALVEELVESAERRVRGKLTGKALKRYLDGEQTYRHQRARLCDNQSKGVTNERTGDVTVHRAASGTRLQ